MLLKRPSRAAAVLLSTAAAATLLVGVPSASASGELSAPCADVESVFARGSGQSTGEPEVVRFVSEIDRRISPALTHHPYELGTETIDGNQYPAVPVGAGSWDSFWNTVGAGSSGGGSFAYGDSVNEGIAELDAYLTERAATCADSVFVLGGYSQGAQTVGETYVETLPDDLRQRVIFQGLFGDPKLHLPEGEGFNPPACRGEEYSEWRRDVPDCDTDGGSLGARDAYLPEGWTSTTGLWCADDDFVCGSAKNPLTTSGHEDYEAAGGDIDAAAREIAERLAAQFPDKADEIDKNIIEAGTGTTGLDVVFLIDSTGSMGWQIEDAKRFAANMATTIQEHRGRVALVEYKDAGDAVTARILSGFNEDTTEFNQQLATIYPYGGGDFPEAVLHALMTAFNGLEWRNGATKAAIVLTDATYHDPDRVDGSTLEAVAKRALEIDPVNVYPVVPAHYGSFYTQLAEATTGEVIVNSGDTEAALTRALTKINTRPVALIKHPHYYAQPGQSIRFDVSDSYSPASEIVSYEWDYNGDGVFEESSTTPVAVRTYSEVFDGVMQVRMTDATGTASNISAFVEVGGAGPDAGRLPAPESLQAAVTATQDGISTVDVTWDYSAAAAYRFGITVNGIPVGMTDGTARSFTVTDIERAEDVEIGVVPFTEAGDMGFSASATVPGFRYDFAGFQPPVSPAGEVSTVTAGRAVPLKFSLGGDQGLEVLSGGAPVSASSECNTVPTGEGSPAASAGGSGLQYDAASDTYTYVWKTDRAWAGTCRVLQVTLDDGSLHEAVFRFSK